MVTCSSVIQRLGGLVDGPHDLAVESILRRHVDNCLSCARYLQTYQTTIALAREAARESSPEDRSGMPEDLVRRILWSRRARLFASTSRQILHLIGVAASPLIVFSLAR